jgi:hypothetical protein
MKRRLRRPSPAFAVSLLALFVALGGTSYAAVGLPKNSVGAKQLQKNAVTSSKIKNHAVTAAKLDTHGLTAPKATSAATVGGQTVKLIQWKAPPSTTTQTIFSAEGLTITGSCDASSNITIDATGSTTKNAELRIRGDVMGTAFFQNVHSFSSASTVSLVHTDGAEHEGSGQLVYATVDGHVVTLSYGFDWGNATSGAYFNNFIGCTMYGEVIYS